MANRCLRLGALVVCLVVAACGGSRTARPADRPPIARDAEASRIALQAQRAQAAGERARAIDLYRQSLSLSDNLPATWNNLGLLLLDDGRYIDAVEAFKRAADLSPSDPRPLHNIGIAYSRAGWEQRAFENYLQALDRDPRDIKALRGSVGSARMLGVVDEASLERARTALMVDNDPDWRSIYQREQSRIEGELRARKTRAGNS